MADVKNIVEEMQKYSQVKKPGVFVRAGETLKGWAQSIGNLRIPQKTVDPATITIDNTPAGMPPEMDSIINDIRNSPVFDQTKLSALATTNPTMLKHIEKLSQSINHWLVKDFEKITGEKNDFNTVYAAWKESGSNFVTVLKEVEKTLSAQSVIEQTEKGVESQIGPAPAMDSDKRLTLAFSHMGLDITKDPNDPNKYSIVENGVGGFTYKDSQGQEQTLRISQKAAQAFIDNYLLSPDKDKIDITPKGLFTYFIQQEIIGKTSKRKLDPQMITAAQNLFSENSPEWQAVELILDQDQLTYDLTSIGLQSLNMDTLDNLPMEEGANFTQHLSGKQADRLVNRWRIRKLEKDTDKAIDRADAAIDANQSGIDSIVAKYQQVLGALEAKEALYPAGQAPAILSNKIESMKGMVQVLESFADRASELFTEAQKGAFKDPAKNITQDAPTDNAQFIKDIQSKLKYESHTRKLVLTDDLPWISKDQFEAFMLGQTLTAQQNNQPSNAPKKTRTRKPRTQGPQTPAYNVALMPDVAASSLGIALPNNMNFEQAMEANAMQERALSFIEQGNNFIANLYNHFKTSGVSAQDYINNLQVAQQQQNGAVPTQDLLGICDLNTLANVFEFCQQREAGLAKQPPVTLTFADNANTNAVRQNAQMAFYHMDCVSTAIFSDQALRDQYEKSNEAERKQMFEQVYNNLRTNNKINPSPTVDQLRDAEARWGHYYNVGSNNRVAGAFVGQPKTPQNMEIVQALADTCSKSQAVFDSETKRLGVEGKSQVDYARDLEAEKENEGDIATIKYGDLFPRGIPKFKIEKSLQPYNIKAGLKMMDMILGALQNIEVINPWGSPSSNSSTGGGSFQKAAPAGGVKNSSTAAPHVTNPSTAAPAASGVVIPDAPVFEGLDDNQVQNRVAMISVGMGINSILDQLDLDQDADAPQVRKAMDYMTMMGADGQPKVKMGDQEVILSDAMQRVFINEFTTGAKTRKRLLRV